MNYYKRKYAIYKKKYLREKAYLKLKKKIFRGGAKIEKISASKLSEDINSIQSLASKLNAVINELNKVADKEFKNRLSKDIINTMKDEIKTWIGQVSQLKANERAMVAEKKATDAINKQKLIIAKKLQNMRTSIKDVSDKNKIIFEGMKEILPKVDDKIKELQEWKNRVENDVDTTLQRSKESSVLAKNAEERANEIVEQIDTYAEDVESNKNRLSALTIRQKGLREKYNIVTSDIDKINEDLSENSKFINKRLDSFNKRIKALKEERKERIRQLKPISIDFDTKLEQIETNKKAITDETTRALSKEYELKNKIDTEKERFDKLMELMNP
uniref:Uncharacterized protein n=1 Tax=Mimivirus LCMiAC01 TaxID=2506608 RepID=A0A481Z096_9VIRU|nr:MAG: hypothetical protein LCMiAC01_02580 [Mimivirus LCMiAC01]